MSRIGKRIGMAIAGGALCASLSAALPALAGAEGGAPPAGDPDLPWLDNAYYKVLLDVRARIELADSDGGFDQSEAYTLRTRAGVVAKPWYGLSALAELENTYSPKSSEYWAGNSPPNGKTIIADPENTELNRLWAQYEAEEIAGTQLAAKAKGGKQRIVFDDSRWIGDVAWRQNDQTFDAALGETRAALAGATAQYGYLWHVQRIFGDSNFQPDWDSDSHVVRLNYAGLENHQITGFVYLLDFGSDSPGNSSNTYGFRANGSFPLDEEWSLGYIASYAFQTDAGSNPVDYHANYGWISASVTKKALGSFEVGYEHLGSDDGKAVVVTPLATAHKFDGYADAFLNNGGPRGLQDLFFTVAPALPWALEGHVTFHEFWRADGGGHLGRELDAVVSRKLNAYLTALAKAAWFDGTSRGPADVWRLTFQLTFAY